MLPDLHALRRPLPARLLPAGRFPSRLRLCTAALALLLNGCAVVAVADATVTVAATAVKVAAKTVGAAVDLVVPDSKD